MILLEGAAAPPAPAGGAPNPPPLPWEVYFGSENCTGGSRGPIFVGVDLTLDLTYGQGRSQDFAPGGIRDRFWGPPDLRGAHKFTV